MSDEQKPQGYRDLLVWQKGIVLTKEVYRLTRSFPAEEKFGLVSQMRRACVSVPSNIAEGQARHTTGAFVQFISNAEGALAELDTQLVISVELEFLSNEEARHIFDLVAELRRMLNGLRHRLEGN
jgi:four helix bundle protein